MKEASHGVFRIGVGINPRPGSADSGSSSRQMIPRWRWSRSSIMVIWENSEAYQIHHCYQCCMFSCWTVMLTIIDVSEVSAYRKFLRLILPDLFPASWSCRICFQHVVLSSMPELGLNKWSLCMSQIPSFDLAGFVSSILILPDLFPACVFWAQCQSLD